MKTLPLRWIALAAWAVALLAVAITVSIPAKSGKLYPTFVAAGDHFRHGQPIYGHIPDGQDQYRYSPLVAAAFAPWGFLPNWVGAVLWRPALTRIVTEISSFLSEMEGQPIELRPRVPVSGGSSAFRAVWAQLDSHH